MSITDMNMADIIEKAVSKTMEPVAETAIITRKKCLTEQEVSKLYSISVSTLQTLRSRKLGPSYIKSGKSVLYTTDELDAWMERRRVKTLEEES